MFLFTSYIFNTNIIIDYGIKNRTQHSESFLGIFSCLININNSNTLVLFFADLYLMKGFVIGTNILFVHLFTCSLNVLLIFNFGLIIYPIENLLIHYFISSSQIKLLAIWNKGRQWLDPNNDFMGILLKWLHLSLF